MHDHCHSNNHFYGQPSQGQCSEVLNRCENDCGGPQTVVPPPIPPVRYVPGMNVQEQLCHMAERVNISIDRWNQIQRDCYKALDNVVGAAVNNDVYYAPDEVRYMEGYSEDAGCSYAVVEARNCDRAGKPIYCNLRPAYNNVTNSGAQENIQNVSFVASAQMVITAVQSTITRWAGSSVFCGNPGNSAPDDTVWIAGFNKNGVLRFFRGDVSQDHLRQNRMLNVIGPVFPIIRDAKRFEEVTVGEETGSIQAMGWKDNGNKVFFSCGMYDQPGMTPTQVTDVLLGMGCRTAVITSYQTKAATAWDSTPLAGTDAGVLDQNDGVITAPGLTGGMTFLGKLTDAPLQWNIPANCVNWVISKKPHHGWRNAFTTEIANVVQNLGKQDNTLASLMGQLKSETDAIGNLQHQVTQNTNNISELKVTVNAFDDRITDTESRLDRAETAINRNKSEIELIEEKLNQEISTRSEQYTELVAADTTEREARIAADNEERQERIDADNTEKAARESADLAEREARQQADEQESEERRSADSALQAAIDAEMSSRKSADTVLENSIKKTELDLEAEDQKLMAAIDSEATTRAQADRNLQAAIEAEQSARSTKDTQHEARMDSLQANIDKDHEEVMGEIEGIKDGSLLPIASETTLGAIMVGDNLSIDETGRLNAQASATPIDPTVIEGNPGITVAQDDNKVWKVGIDDNIVVTEDEFDTQVDSLNTKFNMVDAKADSITTRVDTIEETSTSIKTQVETNKHDISVQDTRITNIAGEVSDIHDSIARIKSGEDLPVASADTLGAIRVGANLSISEDGILSAAGGSEGPGETIAAGTGIKVERDEGTGIATVGLNSDTQASLALIPSKADKTQVDNISTALSGKANKADVTALTERTTAVEEKASSNETKITEVETTANAAASGVNQLNSAQTALGVRVDNAEKEIDATQTTIATAQADIANLRTDLQSVDNKAEAATNAASDAEAIAASKMGKTGDVATGTYTFRTGVAKAEIRGGQYTGTTDDFEGIYFEKDEDAGEILMAVRTGKGVGFSAQPRNITQSDNGYTRIGGIKNPVGTHEAANKTYVDSAVSKANSTAQAALTTAQRALPKSGGVLTGDLTAPNITVNGDLEGANLTASDELRIITNGEEITITADADSLYFVDKLTGSNAPVQLQNIKDPSSNLDACNMKYVNEKFNNIALTSRLGVYAINRFKLEIFGYRNGNVPFVRGAKLNTMSSFPVDSGFEVQQSFTLDNTYGYYSCVTIGERLICCLTINGNIARVTFYNPGNIFNLGNGKTFYFGESR